MPSAQDLAYRSVAGAVGAPVDLATLLLRPFGYSVNAPVGGSEWIGQKLQQAGLVSENRNPIAELIGSALVPGPGIMKAAATVPLLVKAAKTETKLLPKDYGLTHRPMTEEGGASRLHEAYKSFGEDVYSPQAMQYFGSGAPGEKASLSMIQRMRDRPDELVTIYRGVPKDVKGASINPGDWVALDPKVASEYGRVISMKVPASHVTTWPDSLAEFGYYPK